MAQTRDRETGACRIWRCGTDPTARQITSRLSATSLSARAAGPSGREALPHLRLHLSPRQSAENSPTPGERAILGPRPVPVERIASQHTAHPALASIATVTRSTVLINPRAASAGIAASIVIIALITVLVSFPFD